MDAMSSTLLHMRQQLTDSHRQITSLNEENARLKSLCQSTPNGTTHIDSSSNVSTTGNSNNNNIKSSQKRAHPSNRTTQNIIATEKFKPTATSLYDVDEIVSSSPPPPPPPLPSTSSLNEMMEIESNTSTSTNSTNNNINNINNNNNQHIKRTNPLENGINVTP